MTMIPSLSSPIRIGKVCPVCSLGVVWNKIHQSLAERYLPGYIRLSTRSCQSLFLDLLIAKECFSNRCDSNRYVKNMKYHSKTRFSEAERIFEKSFCFRGKCSTPEKELGQRDMRHKKSEPAKRISGTQDKKRKSSSKAKATEGTARNSPG